MKTKILLLIGIILLTSCSIEKRMQRACKLCPSKDTIKRLVYQKEIVRDTTFFIKPDSASWHFYLQCDSANNVLISQLQEAKTAGIKTIVKYKDNTLYVSASIDTAKFIGWVKEKYIKDSSSKVSVKEIVKNELTQWQILQLWLGRGFALILLIIIAYFLIKKFVFKK